MIPDALVETGGGSASEGKHLAACFLPRSPLQGGKGLPGNILFPRENKKNYGKAAGGPR
jgi:hypothetical protein